MNKIYFAKVNEKAVIPSKKDEDAGYDLYACFDEDFLLVKHLSLALIPTGIAWACSPDFYMQIEERSSTGSKGIKRNAGVIDSGYRGEIKISIFNARSENLVFSNLQEDDLKTKYPQLFKEPCYLHYTNKAIAQGIIHRVEQFETQEMSYEDLLKIQSQRGKGGFGSSGK